jgi:hypothetical protein
MAWCPDCKRKVGGRSDKCCDACLEVRRQKLREKERLAGTVQTVLPTEGAETVPTPVVTNKGRRVIRKGDPFS